MPDDYTVVKEEDILQQEIRLSIFTKAICTSCGREDAPYLYLKRRRGLYEALCVMPDGSGCYPNSAKRICSFVDPAGIQCPQLSEWEVRYGDDSPAVKVTCSDHLGRMMRDVSKHNVFPLED